MELNDLSSLVGKTIKNIFLNEMYLQFVTNDGTFTYAVEGDCCSQSVFYDFIGVKKLLAGNPVLKIEVVTLSDNELNQIKSYGYRIITEDKNLGEVSSVFSFRNYSNGYYGGSMFLCGENKKVEPEIFDDVLETDSLQ